MKIPPLHYAVIILQDDFAQNPSQIATRLDLSLRYVYDIVNRYPTRASLTPDYNYECNSHTTQTRLNKYR
jgi:hypothetical protein